MTFLRTAGLRTADSTLGLVAGCCVALSAVALLVAALFVVTLPALAHEVKAGNLTIVHPFARASAGAGRTGAAFMEVHNHGETAERLIAVSVSSTIAGRAEIHTHVMENDVAKMRKIEGGIEIPAGGRVALQPGGLHVMFMKLAKPFAEGDDFTMTLTFENAGEMDVTVPVLAVDAGTGSGMDHGKHDHGDHDHSDHPHGEHDHGEHE